MSETQKPSQIPSADPAPKPSGRTLGSANKNTGSIPMIKINIQDKFEKLPVDRQKQILKETSLEVEALEALEKGNIAGYNVMLVDAIIKNQQCPNCKQQDTISYVIAHNAKKETYIRDTWCEACNWKVIRQTF